MPSSKTGFSKADTTGSWGKLTYAIPIAMGSCAQLLNGSCRSLHLSHSGTKIL
jgi:hypothetical protein